MVQAGLSENPQAAVAMGMFWSWQTCEEACSEQMPPSGRWGGAITAKLGQLLHQVAEVGQRGPPGVWESGSGIAVPQKELHGPAVLVGLALAICQWPFGLEPGVVPGS